MLKKKFYKSSQEKRLAKAISLAGPRYTPRVNVSVSIADVFDGLGRTSKFFFELKKPLIEISKNLRYINAEEINRVAPKEFQKVLTHCQKVITLLSGIPRSGVKKINFSGILSASNKARDAVYKCV